MATGERTEQAPGLPTAFWRLWIGETVSSFGTYVTALALQVMILVTMDGNAQDVGWVNSFRFLPYLLFGLVAGAWVERRRRQPVMVITDLAAGLLLILIPIAWALDMLTVPVLAGLVFLYGGATLVNGAASMAVMPRVIPRGQLQRGHAFIDGSDAVAQTAGPALAGVLIKILGAPAAVLVDAASYFFSAVMMGTLRISEPRTMQEVAKRNVRKEIRDGIRWVYRGSDLRAVAINTHVWFSANAILGVAVPTYALHTLGLSVLQFSITTACAGVGAVLGAAVTTAIGRRLGTGRTVIGTHLLTIVGVLVMVLAASAADWLAVLVLAIGQAMHGVAMGASNSHEMAYRQAMTPDHLQARTNITVHSFNRAVIVVAAPLAGLLATVAGTRASLVVAAGVFGISVLVLLTSPFRNADLTSAG